MGKIMCPKDLIEWVQKEKLDSILYDLELLHSLDGRGDTENIREEMADVEIMLEQLHVIFGYGDYRLVKECRLAERLKG